MKLPAKTIPALRGVLRALASGLLDLIGDACCRACRRPAPFASALCAECRRAIAWNAHACPRCATPLPVVIGAGSSSSGGFREAAAASARSRVGFTASSVDVACGECRGVPWAPDGAFAGAQYSGPMRRLVLAHKFAGDYGARRFLVAALRRAWRRSATPGTGSWCVTSVPQHWTRRIARGRDPCEELARDLARSIAIPYRALMKKTRWTRSQSRLSRSRRRRNLRSGFRCWRRLGGRSVILVDDVITTGSTVNACARVLRRAGAGRIIVLSAARS